MAQNMVFPLASPLKRFCAEVGFSLRHFYDLEKRGEAPATVRIGRRRYVRRSTGEQWLAERER